VYIGDGFIVFVFGFMEQLQSVVLPFLCVMELMISFFCCLSKSQDERCVSRIGYPLSLLGCFLGGSQILDQMLEVLLLRLCLFDNRLFDLVEELFGSRLRFEDAHGVVGME